MFSPAGQPALHGGSRSTYTGRRVRTGPASAAPCSRSGWGSIDFADIFGAGAPAFGGLFQRLFGQPEAGPPRGADLRVDLVISLRQVLTGGTQVVSISRPGPCPECGGSGARPGTAPRPCPDCGGTGQQVTASRRGGVLFRQVTTCPVCRERGQVIDEPCPACHGTGQTVQEEKVTVRIPRGIPDGTALRMAGRGMPSPAPGGPPGDAYVIIRTLPDPLLAREGADLWHVLHISVPDAVLGTMTTVPAPDGQAELPVPPGTQPGAVLAIDGKGLPRYHGHGRGRLNVTVNVDIPQQLSPRQRRLYEQLRAEDAETDDKSGVPEQTNATRRAFRPWQRRDTPGTRESRRTANLQRGEEHHDRGGGRSRPGANQWRDPASRSQPVPIPGPTGTFSYVLADIPGGGVFYSACHGAGRVIGRRQRAARVRRRAAARRRHPGDLQSRQPGRLRAGRRRTAAGAG